MQNTKAVASFLLIIYLLFLFWLLFLYQDQNYSRLSGEPLGKPNLQAFKNIRHYLFVIFQTRHGFPVKWGAAVNLFGNILIFVPVGFLMPFVLHVQNSIRFIFLAILCICMIELFQWIGKVGIFDVDDIILNTVGVNTGILPGEAHPLEITIPTLFRPPR